MEYEDRLIIYIDVLGFADFIKYTSKTHTNKTKKIQRIEAYLSMLRSYLQPNDEISKVTQSKQISYFSDLIVVSVSLSEIENIDIEILNIFFLIVNSISKGFLIRGSIVYGKLIHKEGIIFGEGLIEAYNNERIIAKYPRIIIDRDIIKDLQDLPKNVSRDFNNYISQDTDGYYYVDFLKRLRDYTDSFWEYAKILEGVAKLVLEMMGNPKLDDKCQWLYDKLVEHINIFPQPFNYSFSESEYNKSEILAFLLFLSEFKSEEYKKLK